MNNINSINWSKKNICILGAGKSGISAARLANHINANVLLSDIEKKEISIKETVKFQYEFSGHSNRVLNSDLIIKSPGVPNEINILNDCKKKNIPVISEIEFASWFSKSNSIVVTGSNGKTTTASLLFNIFKDANVNVLLGGNIGIPYSENVLSELKNATQFLHVIEISSYQAEHISRFAPLISCILNISEDHMDRYKNINEYINAKLNLTKNLSKKCQLIYNADDLILRERLMAKKWTLPFSLSDKMSSKVFYKSNNLVFKDDDCYVRYDLSKINLLGTHNKYNIVAASTLANLYGIDHKKIIQTIKKFKPLPHRIEYIAKINNVKYINDSKSTNLASTIAAINCFNNIILIIGGQSKGKVPLEDLIHILENKRIKIVILYGDILKNTKNMFAENKKISMSYGFNQAVIKAKDMSSKGDCVLLSPAFSSFDQFKDYKERGNAFKEIIKRFEDDK